MSEQDKKKVMAMKSKGASRSQLAKVRMNVLMGMPFAKAKRMAMTVTGAKKPMKKKMPEAVEDVIVAED